MSSKDDSMFDVTTLIIAHRSGRVGRVTFELCKLSLWMEQHDWGDGSDYEEGVYLDSPVEYQTISAARSR